MQFPTQPRSPPRLLDTSKLTIDTSHIPILTRVSDLQSHSPTSAPDVTPPDCQSLCQELRSLLPFIQDSQVLFARQMTQFQHQLQQLGRTSSILPFPSNRFPFEPPAPPAPRVAPAAAPPSPVRRQTSTELRSHKRGSVTHSERSRSVSSNPNNVWSRVEPFFAPLPTDEELDEIFAVPPIPPPPDLPEQIEHWSAKYASPAVRANGRATMPPGPPPSPDDISEFWKKVRPTFAMEQSQKKNSCVLSRLVNAFVEVPAGQMKAGEKKQVFVKTHPLLPQFPEEEYLKYGFEVRLGLELESLDLNNPVSQVRQGREPFQQEIDELRKRIETELIPGLQQDLKELKENLPAFRSLEKRRAERQALADRMMQEYTAKKRSKK